MKKLTTAMAGLAIAALALTGCTALLPPEKEAKPTATQTETPVETDEPEAEPAADGAFDGGKDAAPGSSVPGGTWGNIPYIDFDDNEAVLAHQLKSVEKAPQSDVDTLIAEIPELKGMDVYYVTVDTRYVSGVIQPFVSASEFNVVDADGGRTQSLILIGYDACNTNSFGAEDEMKTEVVTSCFASAAAPGGNAPAGLQWSQYETPTEDEPVSFYLK